MGGRGRGRRRGRRDGEKERKSGDAATSSEDKCLKEKTVILKMKINTKRERNLREYFEGLLYIYIYIYTKYVFVYL